MLIRSVTALAFGPLVDQRLDLADGLTVIHGGNESAKSSWHAAIYAAVCGQPRRRPTADGRRFADLHRPWDRPDTWVVRAEVLLDDGRRLEVRQDLAGRVACDVHDLDLGRDCSAEFIGRDQALDLSRWLGLDRQSFVATACVAQAQVLALHGQGGGLQAQLQQAADTAGTDQTAAAALALIDAFGRDRIGTEQSRIKPMPLARATVSRVEAALAQARTAYGQYEQRVLEADRLRAVATAADRDLGRHEAVAQTRVAAGLRRRATEVDAALAELAAAGPVPEVADEETARHVTAALSTWDNMPAEPTVPDVPTVPDEPTAADAMPVDPELASSGTAPGVSTMDDASASVLMPAQTAGPRPHITSFSVDGAVDGSGGPSAPREPARIADHDPVVAAAATLVASLPGSGPDHPGPGHDTSDYPFSGTGASGFPGSGHSVSGYPGSGRVSGSGNGASGQPGLVGVLDRPGSDRPGSEQAGSDDLAPDAGPGTTDPSYPFVTAGPASGPVSDRASGGAVDPTADQTLDELWDLARDLDVVAPPVDPTIAERVGAARAAVAGPVAAGRAGRGRGLWVAAIGLAVLAAGVVGSVVPRAGAVGLAAAGLLMVATFVLVGFGLAGRGRRARAAAAIGAARRELDAALVEAAAALRVEQAALAHRERAEAQARRWSLPADAAAVRQVAQDRLARAAVAERDQEWQRRFQADQHQVEQARQQAEAEAARRLEQAQVEAVRRLEQAQAEAVRRLEQAETEAARRLEQARQEAEDLARAEVERAEQLAREQVEEAVESARLRSEASAREVAAAQRVAEQSRQQVAETHQQIRLTRQRIAERVVAVAQRCGLAVTQADQAVLALRRWQRDQADAAPARDLATRRWSRLEHLLALPSQSTGDDIATAAAGLREEAGRAEIRAEGAADGFTSAELDAVTDADPATLASLREQGRVAARVADAADGSCQAQAQGLVAVGEIEEELARAEAEVVRLRELAETLTLTRTFLAAAQERAHRSIAPVLIGALEKWLPTVTGGRYTSAKVDWEQLRVQVRGPAGRWRDADALSHGTAEQVYLLLRLALAEHLARPGTVCPLLLDDVTVHADTERTEQILELLLAAAAERQIILFSQQQQVYDWADARLDGPHHRLHRLPPLATV